METRAHHVVIGLFTLIVVSAALLFCLWLTNSVLIASSDCTISFQ